MKIIELDIYGFGKFIQKKFTFNSDIQIIFGENEAGKSTIFAFIHSILFGFPTKSEYTQNYEPISANTYGGSVTLQLDDNSKVTIFRIRKLGKTEIKLIFSDGVIAGEDRLKEVLSGIDRDFFEKIFSFSLDGLKEVYKVNENEIGKYLMYTGISGSDRLWELEGVLQKKGEQIFKKGGRTTPLNIEIKGLSESSKNLNDALEKEMTFNDLLSEQNELRINLEENIKGLEKIDEVLQHLAEQKYFRPLDQERKTLQDDLKGYSNIKFPTNGINLMNELLDSYTPARQYADRIKQKLIELNRKKNSISVNKTIANKSLEISSLEKLYHQLEMIDTSSKKIRLQLQNTENQINDIYNELSIVPGSFDIEALDLSVIVKERLQNIHFEESKLEHIKIDLEKRLFDVKSKLENHHDNVTFVRNNKNKNPMNSIFLAIITSLMIGLSLIMLFVTNNHTATFFFAFLIILSLFLIINNRSKIKNRNNNHLQNNYINDLENECRLLENETEKNKNNFHSLYIEREQYSRSFSLSSVATGKDLQNVFERLLVLKQMVIENKKNQTTLSRNIEDLHARKEIIQQICSELELQFSGNELETVTRIIFHLQETNDSRMELDAIEMQITELEEELVPEIKIITSLKKKIDELLNEADCPDVASFFEKAKECEDYLNSKNNLLKIEDQLRKINFDDCSESELDQHLERTKQIREELVNDLDDYRTDIAEIGVAIKQIEDSGTVEELQQFHEIQLENYNENAKEWIKIAIAKGILENTIARFKENKFPAVIEVAEEHIKFLTNGKYERIFFSEEKNGLYLIDNLGNDIKARDLSRGTSELLFVALKLSFVQSFQNDLCFPLILDDILVNFDTKRSKRMIELIKMIGELQQVIFLTCHRHIAKQFNSNLTLSLSNNENEVTVVGI